MQLDIKNPPRPFSVGKDHKITIKDCASISLEPDEQVTFINPDNSEFDVARKNWGFYATPSINGRLANYNFKTAFVKNSLGKYYVMLVEKEKSNLFKEYLNAEELSLVCWLDDEQNLDKIDNLFKEIK